MKWTDNVERLLLELWHESEGRCQKKMVSKKQQRECMWQKLKDPAGVDADLSSLTSVAIKNKLDALIKKGKCLIEKLVQPLLKDRPSTGSAADEAPPSSDPVSSIDWEDMNRLSRWCNFNIYYRLFGSHPTRRVWRVMETGSDSESDNRRLVLYHLQHRQAFDLFRDSRNTVGKS